MATQTFSKSGSTITVNSYSTDNPPHYKITADDSNHLVLINADDNSFNLQVNAALDTITINGTPFTGTATELRTALLADIFVSTTPTTVTVLSQKKTLTDAEIKALPTTPYELIPAAGAGKVIMFVGAYLRFDYSAGQYTNRDLDCIIFTALNGWAGTAASNFSNLEELTQAGRTDLMIFLSNFNFDSSTGAWANYNFWTDNVQNDAAKYVNKPLHLMIDNASAGNLTGGNPANTLDVTVLYSIVDL